MNITEIQTKKQLHGNVEEQDKQDLSSDQLVERYEVEKTPFHIVKQNDKFLVTIGKYRLTKELDSRHEAEMDAKRVDWERIMAIMGIMIENYNEINK